MPKGPRITHRLVAIAGALSLLAAGCSHTVTIDSEPTGAEISVNGEQLGTAPVAYTETTGWDKVYDINAKKAGFKITKKTVKQSEWNTPILVVSVAGFFLCGTIPAIGLLWAKQLPDRVVVPLESGSDAPPPPPPPPATGVPPANYGY